MAPASAELRRLTKRQEFLRAARGNRAGRPNFALQSVPVKAPDAGLGFTVTKKVGNAPERNRIKRRLRAAARAASGRFRPGYDYVLIGRREALSADFASLVGDLAGLIEKVHAQRAPAKPAPGQAETRQ